MMTVSFLFNFSVISKATTSAVLLVQAFVCLGCLLGRFDSQTYSSKKVLIKSSLTLNALSTVACAACYSHLDSQSAGEGFVIATWSLLSVSVITALLVMIACGSFKDTAIPMIALLTNFFMVGVCGFLELAKLGGILAVFSIIYFAYGLKHSKLSKL